MYNVASGFILIIGNFTTMNKFILVIAMVCCITQLCSRFNAIYGTKHHIDMLNQYRQILQGKILSIAEFDCGLCLIIRIKIICV